MYILSMCIKNLNKHAITAKKGNIFKNIFPLGRGGRVGVLKNKKNCNKDRHKLTRPASTSFSGASMAYLSYHLQHASTLSESPNNQGGLEKKKKSPPGVLTEETDTEHMP